MADSWAVKYRPQIFHLQVIFGVVYYKKYHLEGFICKWVEVKKLVKILFWRELLVV